MTADPLSAFRAFRAAGPVAAAFLADRSSIVKCLMGPVGGGKTISCVYDSIRAASLTPPCNDGIIRYRRAIIGTTYGQIERNLYPSWKRWCPTDNENQWTEQEWKGGGGRFATHDMSWNVLAGNHIREVRAQYLFAAIGDAAVEEFMRGFEPTDVWLYETDQHVEATMNAALTRIGRYPATGDARDAVPRSVGFHRCVVGDLNAPDIDSWFFRRFEEADTSIDLDGRVYKLSLYKQPSGLAPKAENIQNLPDGYYSQQVASLSGQRNGRNLIRRMVHAQYAPSSHGEPIYGDDYSDDVHLIDAIEPLKGVPLELGFDQGLRRPACVITQTHPSTGQCRVLAEVVPGRMSAPRFAKQVQLKCAEVAPGCRLADIAYCDPAGFDGADKEGGETAWAEQVARELGITILPTETNEVEPRIEAVAQDLRDRIDAHTPGLVIDKRHCPLLRRGFVSHYRYERVRIGNTERTKDQPEKTDESNPHDALQYQRLGKKGRSGVIRFEPRAERAPARSAAGDTGPRWLTQRERERQTLAPGSAPRVKHGMIFNR